MNTPRVIINRAGLDIDGRAAQLEVDVDGRRIVLRVVIDPSSQAPTVVAFADGNPDPVVVRVLERRCDEVACDEVATTTFEETAFTGELRFCDEHAADFRFEGAVFGETHA